MNKKHLLLAVDLGTTNIKAGVYDSKGESVGTVEVVAPMNPNNYNQNGESFLKETVKAIEESIKKNQIDSSSIEGICFSGQMGGSIGIDVNWEPVTEWSNALNTDYLVYTSKMLSTCREQILELSGTNSPYFAPKILWWKNDFPELYKKTLKFMILNGYIAGKMGNININDSFISRTYLQMTGLADIVKNEWSKELCSLFGIDLNKLPRIVDSTEIIGKLSLEFANYCGLKQGTPLIAGAGDKPSGYLGAGIVKPGMLINESASFSTFSLCADKYIPDLNFKTFENIPSPIENQYFPTIILIGSGKTIKWFAENFGKNEMNSIIDLLEKSIKRDNDFEKKTLSISLLGGRVTPSCPNIRGMWFGYDWSDKKEHFYKSILESFGYEYSLAIRKLCKIYPHLKFQEVRVIGGGSASELENKINSNITGISYISLSRNDFTLLGNIIIAGKAIGLYDDMSKIAQEFTQEENKRYMPDPNTYKDYIKFVNLYEKLIARTEDIYTELESIQK